MKSGLFLISLLAMAACWYWIGHRQGRSIPFAESLRNALKSVAFGIAVYFFLVFIMLIYLLTASH